MAESKVEDTVGKVITCRAAIAWEANKPLVIEEVLVDPPQAGEVRVKIEHSALCHTDHYTLSGQDGEAAWPAILGHEGSGIVESVGEGVTSCAVGDVVIPLYIPECRDCKFCNSGKTNLCSKIRATQGRGLMPDGTSRFKSKRTGDMLYHYMGISSFSQYTVCADISIAVVAKEAPREKVCLLGCGVTTGFGAVTRTMKVEEGATVAVMGLGAVGLAAIMGAKHAKASRIIAVDINADKFAKATELGATECVNPKDHSPKTIQSVLIDMTDGGLDYTFECIGNVLTMKACVEAAHKGWGQACIIGVAPAGAELSFRPFNVVTGRKVTGSAFGGVRGRTELPGIVDDVIAGEGAIQLDPFITHTITLDEVNKGFDLMISGESIRAVMSLF